LAADHDNVDDNEEVVAREALKDVEAVVEAAVAGRRSVKGTWERNWRELT
jgi:hypothetical protein